MPKLETVQESSLYYFSQPFITSTVQILPPASPSLINYVPSSIGSCFQTRFEDSLTDLSSSRSSLLSSEQYTNDNSDPRCEELLRALRDEAGVWISDRFTFREWYTCEYKSRQSFSGIEYFDGHLTKEIIASGLSDLDRCPVFYHYSYIKCELSRKKLCDIDAIASYHYLQYVYVAGNKLTTLSPLGNLPFLKYLDASRNRLTTILDFKPPYFLTTANLSRNKFKVMRDLKDFWSITDLDLSHNEIKKIHGLLELRYLTMLNLSFNKIETIKNLNNLRVQFLYLQNNLIRSSEDDENAMLHTLNNIRSINLSNNQISSLKMLESVENLERLEMVNNHISQLLDIYYLRNLKYLNILNLMGNSVTQLRRYVEVCVTNIENLTYLDGQHINLEFWLQKLSDTDQDVGQKASHQRLKLLILEQLNKPQIWDWILPYDTPPLTVIILVGLQASKRAFIAKKFCKENDNVVVGIPYTTKPKHRDEIEGEHHYYINDEEFRAMLKEGKFLTYQEHLGFYYGFAHSEFRKAENGILLFHTDLTMALSLKSRFLNTKLVLTLPSTKKVHLENLRKLYAIRLLDMGTMKIINSRARAKDCEMEFDLHKKSCLAKEVYEVLDDLVNSIVTQELNFEKNRGPDDTMEQLWTNIEQSRQEAHISRLLTPESSSYESSTLYLSIEKEEFNPNEHFQKNQSQVHKYVSFTGAQVHNIEDNSSSSSHGGSEEGSGKQMKEDESLVTIKRPPQSRKTLEKIDLIGSSAENAGKVRSIPSKPSSVFFMEHPSYTDILDDDERIKAIFNDELNQRDELLNLYWSMPGLFRELVFSDYEEEALRKLKQLVKDMTKLGEDYGKPMFHFDNDQNAKNLADDKLRHLFLNLKRELSISDKQAAEFSVETEPYICGNSECKNQACPRF